MNQNTNVIIRMGAAHWDVRLRHGGEIVSFDMRRMSKEGRRTFTKEFVKAFREQRIAA